MYDPKTHLCFCGPMEDAVKVGQEMFAKATAIDCPVWAFQVASVMLAASLAYLNQAEKEDPTGDLSTFSNSMVAASLKINDAYHKHKWTPEELKKAIEEAKV